jgi:hypothetical protein
MIGNFCTMRPLARAGEGSRRNHLIGLVDPIGYTPFQHFCLAILSDLRSKEQQSKTPWCFFVPESPHSILAQIVELLRLVEVEAHFGRNLTSSVTWGY